MQHTKCDIHKIVKRRDGKYRYWCLEHKADATAKYGVRLDKCRKADIPLLTQEEIFDLKIENYQGGIALWGAVPAVYDTTSLPVDRGIHLHTRNEVGGKKTIDHTYRRLNIDFQGSVSEITEEDAIYYMVAVVMGINLVEVRCNHCNYSHLDKDVLSVNYHKKHLCSGCGREFYDKQPTIGNPIMKIKESLGDPLLQRKVKATTRKISIKQEDYLGGIQVWGSNQAIFWNSPLLEEEGIHIHCCDKDGQLIIDDTFGEVEIDNVLLDPLMVRIFMAQSAIPHIQESLMSLVCPKCNEPHFDYGIYSHTPHIEHKCAKCSSIFQSPFRKKKTISNPLIEILHTLEKNSVNPRQNPSLDLLSEGTK